MTALRYRALGREWNVVYGNGMVASHLYDEAGRELQRQYLDVAGAPLEWYTATYDPAGSRLTHLRLDGVGHTYTYDAAGQLTEEVLVWGVLGEPVYHGILEPAAAYASHTTQRSVMAEGG